MKNAAGVKSSPGTHRFAQPLGTAGGQIRQPDVYAPVSLVPSLETVYPILDTALNHCQRVGKICLTSTEWIRHILIAPMP